MLPVSSNTVVSPPSSSSNPRIPAISAGSVSTKASKAMAASENEKSSLRRILENCTTMESYPFSMAGKNIDKRAHRKEISLIAPLPAGR